MAKINHEKYPLIIGAKYESVFNPNQLGILHSVDLKLDVIEVKIVDMHGEINDDYAYYWRGKYNNFIDMWSIIHGR
jgi:hypothetical protein